MPDLIFATPISAGASEREAVLLARCIRTFGGALAQNPILALTPGDAVALSPGTSDVFQTLGIELIPFPIGAAALAFPFAIKAFAAAAAEGVARGRGSLLAWLDSDTLVLHEPQALLFGREKALACCPIHHVRIGPSHDDPLDPFWRLVYDVCETPEERAFLMHTAVDGDRIRPHINAGLLVVRPERGLLTAWRETFARAYRRPDFERFYAQNVRYRIFVHQAILSATVLSLLTPEEFLVLPDTYNYPLHLHSDFPPARAAASLNALVTCRYDGWEFFETPGWSEPLRIEELLRSWLERQISSLAGARRNMPR
jgi:hypothetical protein